MAWEEKYVMSTMSALYVYMSTLLCILYTDDPTGSLRAYYPEKSQLLT